MLTTIGMFSMKKILVIEDNQDIANLVAMHLRDTGFHVDICNDGATGFEQAIASHYDLIILDLMLPGKDGISICSELRSQAVYTPILMLTAKTTETDRVLGLEIGADDYLTKPFSVRELVARTKAIFRRVESLSQAEPPKQSLHFNNLRIDLASRQVLLHNKPVDLTAKEFDLLWYFAKHPGQVFTRNQLLDSVWGYGHDGYEHTVNSHINRLRAKIESDPSKPDYIHTVWGVGYKFSDSQGQAHV
jgi:two-component system OmpR family response regulator